MQERSESLIGGMAENSAVIAEKSAFIAFERGRGNVIR